MAGLQIFSPARLLLVKSGHPNMGTGTTRQVPRVGLHLLFPKGSLREEAHWKATEVEAALKKAFSIPVHTTTHLEPREEHDAIHQKLKAAKE